MLLVELSSMASYRIFVNRFYGMVYVMFFPRGASAHGLAGLVFQLSWLPDPD
jgi:hypothetical protein